MSVPETDEQPLLIVALEAGRSVSTTNAFLTSTARSASADDVAFVDAIAHTATGKIRKDPTRDRFAADELPRHG